MSDELKLDPCPFCGGDATIEEVPTASGANWSVGCNDEDGQCYGYQSLQTFARKCEAVAAWNRRVPAPAVPGDVAQMAHNLRTKPPSPSRDLNAATMLEAQAAEMARLRSEAETTSAALSKAWVREAAAISQRDAALDACNQARLAFGGYVSQQSAVDKLDAALTHPTGDRA